MYLVLALGAGALTITPENDVAGAHRYLSAVGTLHITASAGKSSASDAGEAPSLTVTLSNEGRRLSAIAGNPLRARVDVYNDDDSLFFAGVIASIRYGQIIEWTLES